MPAIVADYNNHMGGIDILDSFLAKYRFRIRSRRWYIYLFWHFLSVALVNSWLMYKRECRLLQLPDKQMLPQRKFQAIVAECPVSVDSDKKRGRHTSSNPLITKQKVVNIPCADVRKYQVAHWPAKSEKRGRCKLCEINNTNTMCSKCGVRLCFVDGRNCFVDFHA
ncbi:piggyBac transposable element-derived protein 2-like [Watersipora subatra]|uniref:piggyBac transposable element-derived protein 2-like n=1 Tax=Watersipora subatra TaxID=2589382 RepID=UPI00355BD170